MGWRCEKCGLNTSEGLEVVDRGEWMKKVDGRQVIVDMEALEKMWKRRNRVVLSRRNGVKACLDV